MEFIELIDQAAAILQKKELDDDELQDAIAAVNRYYQENIYEE